MENKDLWPDFEDIPKITSPRSILIEQANFLAQKTKNLLEGKVTIVNSSDGKIFHIFHIVAPLIKNYQFKLFTLNHGAIYYPCEGRFQSKTHSIHDEEVLREFLKLVFNDDSTKKVIFSLLGQSIENEESK